MHFLYNKQFNHSFQKVCSKRTMSICLSLIIGCENTVCLSFTPYILQCEPVTINCRKRPQPELRRLQMFELIILWFPTKSYALHSRQVAFFFWDVLHTFGNLEQSHSCSNLENYSFVRTDHFLGKAVQFRSFMKRLNHILKNIDLHGRPIHPLSIPPGAKMIIAQYLQQSTSGARIDRNWSIFSYQSSLSSVLRIRGAGMFGIALRAIQKISCSDSLKCPVSVLNVVANMSDAHVSGNQNFCVVRINL